MPGPADSPRRSAGWPASSTPPASTSPPSSRSTAPCATRTPTSSRSGQPFVVPIGGRTEEARVFRAGGPGHGPAGLLHRAPRVLQPATASTARAAPTTPTITAASRFFALAALDGAAPPGEGADPAARARLAHRARAGLPPHHARRTSATRGRAATVRVGAQSRLPGPLSARGHARHRPPLGAVQLAAARVVRQGELPEGRPGVRRPGDHREPDPGARAPHPGGGFGLHDVFVGLGDRLVGVLNGIDQRVWNPATDTQITAQYSADKLEGKRSARPRSSAPSGCRSADECRSSG